MKNSYAWSIPNMTVTTRDSSSTSCIGIFSLIRRCTVEDIVWQVMNCLCISVTGTTAVLFSCYLRDTDSLLTFYRAVEIDAV